MRRPDRDGQLRISGVIDGERQPRLCFGALSRALGAPTRVPRCDYHDDAGSHQTVHFFTKRATPTGKPPRIELVTETDIDPMNLKRFAIAIKVFPDVFQRADDVAGAAFT